MFQQHLAPVALFVFARPAHTRQTLDALLANDLASKTDLIVYSDGARAGADETAVQEVRDLIRALRGFKSVTLIERPRNYGLASNIISGVTETLNQFGQIIVLEDDLVTSPHFLDFMNQGLAKYRDKEKVASIHGYCYPVKDPIPELFFLRGADCWGWATWSRAWDCFESNGTKLLAELKQRDLIKEFDRGISYRVYSKMLKKQIAGRNNSWAIRWHASTFLNGMYTLYSRESLINNIGHDASGVHCAQNDHYGNHTHNSRIMLKDIAIVENADAVFAFRRFYESIRPSLLMAILGKLKQMVGMQ
ncbi:hypothetical protein IGB42_04041 [Andreprevotia sp. IGB-42]|uniref:glycosyltransferase n=1 Tax=Andreprevotia sp. IGB-42 TaxID=2497473 RepID=UPI00135A72CC|nr:glycosyltransferase [Andreprevotia sp. IGB-42]KAF0811509.1 hypothetical protein IGB42_04041 [Andreprevotia sp. IGB-42]